MAPMVTKICIKGKDDISPEEVSFKLDNQPDNESGPVDSKQKQMVLFIGNDSIYFHIYGECTVYAEQWYACCSHYGSNSGE